MTPPRTSIRLIDIADAPAIASHLARDAKEFSRWEPTRPNGFHTTTAWSGQPNRTSVRRSSQRWWVARGHRGRRCHHRAGGGEHHSARALSGGLPQLLGRVHVSDSRTCKPRGGPGITVMTDELGLRRADAHTQMEHVRRMGYRTKKQLIHAVRNRPSARLHRWRLA